MKVKTSSSDYVYDELKKEIMFLELLPGQTVNEVETAGRFSVSRTPIRDAFKRLEVEGLIEVRRGHGTFVSLINIDEIDDIMFMREVLEIAAVKEIGALTRSEKIELELLLLGQRELLDGDLDDFGLSRTFLEHDNELHEAIFRLANKPNVWKRISSDRPHYNRLRVLTNLYRRDELERLYEEHKVIVAAIADHNYAAIDTYYRRHLHRGMENLSEIVSRNRSFFTGNNK